MPKPRALTTAEAKRSLAHRFGPRADRLRQFATKFGIRPYRVFLIWTRWWGDERGEGRETEIKRVEILPNPKVESLDAVAYSPSSAGTIPLGSIRLTGVSVDAFTFDLLEGRHADVIERDDAKTIKGDVSFFYEIVEDGRGDDPPTRARFRLATTPFRRAEKVDWLLVLERASEDRTRAGTSQIGEDD